MQPAMPKPAKRGRPITLPDWWIADVRAYWDSSGKSLETLGTELAPLLGEERPLSPSRVYQYISGAKTTAEMTDAFAALMGTHPPVLGLDDEPLRRWLSVGRLLKELAPERFADELAVLSELTETLGKFRRRK
jgi:hypothetical protein